MGFTFEEIWNQSGITLEKIRNQSGYQHISQILTYKKYKPNELKHTFRIKISYLILTTTYNDSHLHRPYLCKYILRISQKFTVQ